MAERLAVGNVAIALLSNTGQRPPQQPGLPPTVRRLIPVPWNALFNSDPRAPIR
jgi:hypothetical protein